MQLKIPFFSRLFDLLENYCIHVSKTLLIIVLHHFYCEKVGNVITCGC